MTYPVRQKIGARPAETRDEHLAVLPGLRRFVHRPRAG